MPSQALTLDEYANQDVKMRGNHSTALWEMPRQVLPTKSTQHTFDAECKSHNYTILYPHPLWSNHLRPKTFIECSVTYVDSITEGGKKRLDPSSQPTGQTAHGVICEPQRGEAGCTAPPLENGWHSTHVPSETDWMGKPTSSLFGPRPNPRITGGEDTLRSH